VCDLDHLIGLKEESAEERRKRGRTIGRQTAQQGEEREGD